MTFQQFLANRNLVMRRSNERLQERDDSAPVKSLAYYSTRPSGSISSSFATKILSARSSLSSTKQDLQTTDADSVDNTTIDQWISEVQGAQGEVQSVANYQDDERLSAADEVITSALADLEAMKDPTAPDDLLSDSDMLNLLQDIRNRTDGVTDIQSQTQAMVDATAPEYTATPATSEGLDTGSGSNLAHQQVARLSNGDYVVIWEEGSNGSRDVRGQVYQEDGTKVGSEFKIEYTSYSDDYEASVTALDGGGFVVSWTTEASGAVGVMGQMFENNGTKNGADFTINTSTSEDQTKTDIVALADGGFAAVWQSDHNEGLDILLVDENDIYFKRYDADGNVTQGETGIHQDWSNEQTDAAIAGLAGGGYVVTWTDETDGKVYASVYNAGGGGVKTNFLLDSDSTTTNQSNTNVTALDEGGYVVTWTADDADGTGVYAQRYDASGNAVWSQEVRINDAEAQNQDTAIVKELNDGNLAFVWESNDSGADYAVNARVLDSDGAEVVEEFQIAANSGSAQTDPSVLVTDDGFRVFWTSDSGQIKTQDITTGMVSGGDPDDDTETVEAVNNELIELSNLLDGLTTGDDLAQISQEAYHRLNNIAGLMSKLDPSDGNYAQMQTLLGNIQDLVGDLQDHVVKDGMSSEERASQMAHVSQKLGTAIDLLQTPGTSKLDITSSINLDAGPTSDRKNGVTPGEFVIYRSNINQNTKAKVVLDHRGSIDLVADQRSLLAAQPATFGRDKDETTPWKEKREDGHDKAADSLQQPLPRDPARAYRDRTSVAIRRRLSPPPRHT